MGSVCEGPVHIWLPSLMSTPALNDQVFIQTWSHFFRNAFDLSSDILLLDHCLPAPNHRSWSCSWKYHFNKFSPINSVTCLSCPLKIFVRFLWHFMLFQSVEPPQNTFHVHPGLAGKPSYPSSTIQSRTTALSIFCCFVFYIFIWENTITYIMGPQYCRTR